MRSNGGISKFNESEILIRVVLNVDNRTPSGNNVATLKQ